MIPWLAPAGAALMYVGYRLVRASLPRLLRPRRCPAGCGCRYGTTDPIVRDCLCKGPCVSADHEEWFGSLWDRTVQSYRVGAVDPGETWCGLAIFDLVPGSRFPGPNCLDQSRRGRIRLMTAVTLTPVRLYEELEGLVSQLDHLVLERYSLYPWLAREQGYSEMLTAQCVGVVRYICRKAGLPYTQQDSKGNLKEGRAIAARSGFTMVERSLGSGRFKYRGPDFKLPGKPHRRDACAHGVRWAARDKSSPLVAGSLDESGHRTLPP